MEGELTGFVYKTTALWKYFLVFHADKTFLQHGKSGTFITEEFY